MNAAISTGADRLWTSPYALTGAGVTIGLWDGGSGRATHQEFGGRLNVMDGSSPTNHATHVGGTLIASGANPAAKGMAPAATVKSYDWLSDITEMTAAGATYPGEPDKIYLSNHSYGFVSGWNYVGNSTRTWEWYGTGTGTTPIEEDFGRYNENARESDALAFDAPYYLIFRSAGNDRLDNPAAGQNVALSPGGAAVPYNAALHPAGDGNYRSGFDTIGYNAIAKNVITIGSVTARDLWGLTAVGSVRLRVERTPSGLVVSPATAVLPVGTAQQFSATLLDQFGQVMPDASSSILWESNGGGSVTPTGLFTALSACESCFITARHGAVSNSALVTTPPGQASIVFENLSQTYDGTPKPVTARTSPENLAVIITYNGNPTPPTAPGTYGVAAFVDDANRQGIANDTLIIAPVDDFITWRKNFFSENEETSGLADDLADPDADGHTNLTEYALGTHPRQFTPRPAPARDLDGLSFTFTRPANLPGITYAVESSEDLVVWRPALLELMTPGATESMRARDPLDTGDPTRRFLRLRIIRE